MPVTLQGHSKTVVKIRFSPDGKWLASASSDNTVKLWDIAARRKRTWHEHKDSVYAVAFSAMQPCWPRRARIEPSRSGTHGGRELQSLSGHQDTVWSLAFTPDGKHLCSGGTDRIVIIWDLTSARRWAGLPAFFVTFAP